MPEVAIEPPSVLHVAEAFGGGLFEMVRLVAERSAESGGAHTIAFARRPETPEDPRSAIDARVGLVELAWRRRSPITQITAAHRLRSLFRELQPDVVHLHSSFAGAVGMPALRGKAPIVFTPHAFASSIAAGSPTRSLAMRQVERLIVRSATAVGAVSASEAELALALGARRVECIPNGIPELDSVTWSDPDEWSGSRPRVIAVGRLIDQRQPLACARILAGVRDVADVAWIGGGGYGEALGKRALQALIEAGAPPTGWLPRETVLAELRRTTAYLHWTAWDGLALSLIEAIACDAVAVASDLPPNRELLDPRQLCATESEAIEMLRRVVAEPDFAEELRQAQRERAARHSAAAMVAGWNDLYEALAGNRSRRRPRNLPSESPLPA